MRRACAIIIAALVALGSAACDKASHENIDKWLGTQKGLDKLNDAMRDSDLGADLRGHAAVNLIRKGRDESVYKYLDEQSPPTRQKMIGDMVPRLWKLARIEGELDVPTPLQTSAKDALFFLRKHADDATRDTIDGYLLDWLTGGYYGGRAEVGRVRGEQIIRGISDTPKRADSAADRLIASLNAIIAAAPNEKGGVKKIDDPLILALAVTGSPKAIGKLLEIADSAALKAKHKDLEKRVMILLENAYVDPEGLYEAADPRGLAGDDQVFDTIVSRAKDETRGDTIVSIAINLVRAAGMPKCMPALVGMISNPHANPRYKWIVAKRALDCGQVAAIAPVASAFSTKGEYAEIDLRQVLIEPISAMTPRAEVAKNARVLLGSDSWVARLVGLEVLGKLRLGTDAAADAAAVGKLAGDKSALRGYFGESKKPPTLGQRAAEVAKSLEELAKGSP